MQSHTEGLLCPRGCDSQSGGFADVSSFQSSPWAQAIFVPFAQMRRWSRRGLRKRSTSHTLVSKAQGQVEGRRWDSRPHTERSATRLCAACPTSAVSTCDQCCCRLGQRVMKVVWSCTWPEYSPRYASMTDGEENSPSGGPRSANLKHTLPCPRWNTVIISCLLSLNNPHGTSRAKVSFVICLVEAHPISFLSLGPLRK